MKINDNLVRLIVEVLSALLGAVIIVGMSLWFAYSYKDIRYDTVRVFFDDLNKKDMENLEGYLDEKGKRKGLLDSYQKDIKRYKVKYDIESMELVYINERKKIAELKVVYTKSKKNKNEYIEEKKTEKFRLIKKDGKYLIDDIVPLEVEKSLIEDSKTPL